MTVAIYTRTRPYYAWQFERFSNLESAKLDRDVNKGFDVETLIVPSWQFSKLPELLDSIQTQADIPLPPA